MDFSSALHVLREGERVRRPFYAPDAFLILVPGSTFTVQDGRPIGDAMPELVGKSIDYEPHIDFVVPSRGTVYIWPAPHYDLLADDWEVVRNGHHH